MHFAACVAERYRRSLDEHERLSIINLSVAESIAWWHPDRVMTFGKRLYLYVRWYCRDDLLRRRNCGVTQRAHDRYLVNHGEGKLEGLAGRPDHAEAEAIAAEVLESLPPRERKMAELLRDGYSCVQAGKQLGMSSSPAHRLRNAIRKLLSQE